MINRRVSTPSEIEEPDDCEDRREPVVIELSQGEESKVEYEQPISLVTRDY